MIKYNYTTKRIEGKVKSYDRERWVAIDFDFKNIHESLRPTKETLKLQQVMLYTMCGGGMLGRSAMCQPADFYIDLRVGRLPFPHKDIFMAVEMIKAICDYLGENPHKLPEPQFFGSWVF